MHSHHLYQEPGTGVLLWQLNNASQCIPADKTVRMITAFARVLQSIPIPLEELCDFAASWVLMSMLGAAPAFFVRGNLTPLIGHVTPTVSELFRRIGPWCVAIGCAMKSMNSGGNYNGALEFIDLTRRYFTEMDVVAKCVWDVIRNELANNATRLRDELEQYMRVL